ncbi:hypothetical protein SFOMI_4063 [Sphingobium fuliginis]|uniref:Uncharacterized protein n=1 Tax=Sphingobium fuliginis (strain ATCC 27551) TaxID=336203 RepID=A0A292ZKT2_SPHSA|nr:hypothetical protein SFOMI_4063 [Sphingobium fuliginis]
MGLRQRERGATRAKAKGRVGRTGRLLHDPACSNDRGH